MRIKTNIIPVINIIILHSGLRLSSLSLGAWITYGGQVKDEDATFECMKAAYDVSASAH